MTHKQKIAIVILNWNGAALFEKFLPSVIRNSQLPGTSVIIADNGSSDHSIQILQNKYPEVEILDLGKNYGFAEGYNQALQRVNAEYLVLLNSDVEVTPGWMEKCMAVFEENEKIAAIQPKILSFEKPHLFEYAGAAGGFIDKYGYPFCRGRILNQIEPDVAQYNMATPIFWASGACLFIRAETFKEAGGFDGDFWAHMEEIDLCWRLNSMGYEIWYQPESVVFHLGGGTLSYGSPQKIFLNFRNNLYMLYKNLPKNKVKSILFTRMILDGVAAIKFLAGFNFSAFAAVFKAHLHFYNHYFTLRAKREETQKLTTVNAYQKTFQKSIMWLFFVKKKTKFSELNF